MKPKNRNALLSMIRYKKHDLHKLFKDHVEWREIHEEKKNTLIALRQWYRNFTKFLYQYDTRNVSLSNMGIGKAYKEYLEIKGYANWTVQCHFKTMLATTNRLGLTHDLSGKELFRDYAKHSKANEDHFLLDEEVKQLLSLNLKNKAERIILDRFLVACFTGCRVSEIASVEVVNEETLKYRAIKTQKDILVPYPDHIKPLIESARFKTVLTTTYINNGKFLHIILKRLKWNKKETVHKLYGKKKVATKVPRHELITFHSARKFYGKMLLDRDVTMYKVSQLLGHSSVNTTEKYYAALSREKMIKETVDVVNKF